MIGSNKGSRPLRADKRYAAKAGRTKTDPKVTATKRTAAPAKAAAKPKATTARRKTPARRGGGGGRRGGIGAFVMRWTVGLVWRLSWRLGLIAAVILAVAVGVVYSSLPSADALVDGRAKGSVTLTDEDGDIFAWRGDQFGGMVTADSVSPHLKNAIVATEDRRFYSHFGLDPIGILGAIRINMAEGRSPLSGHGGSTLTQQTAKLMCLGRPYNPEMWDSEAEYEADCRRTTLMRKGREALYAMALEAKFTKDEILTIYMNRAYLGAGTYGFQAASERYFGKPASEVNPAEAAMLAGLLVAPTRYAPTSDIDRSRARADTIIGLMADQGYLTTAEAQAARANPAELSPAAQARAGGYFADWVMDTAPPFLAEQTTEDVIITTTFDSEIQQAAETAMRQIFETKVMPGSEAQAAIVVMSPDGAVRAMVGGRDTTAAGQFNRATQALRQTGSAFKPFIYAAALELGYSPNDVVGDEPLTITTPGSGPWSPSNYDNRFRGNVTMTQALRDSLNIPAVKISEAAGRDNVRKIATDFGIRTEINQGPALALGTSETTLLQMTAAYAGILNGGQSVAPYGLTSLRLMGDEAPLMGKAGGIGERVISRDAAETLTWMMHQVVEDGTGRAAQLSGREVAGKTGTTQSARDAWFIGFTGDYVAGVWMGYDNNTPMTGVTGGGLPADIWRETMARVLEGQPVTPLPMQAPPQPVAQADPTPQAQQPAPSQPSNRTAQAPSQPTQIQPQGGPGLGATVEGAVRGAERAIGNALRSIFGG